VKKSLASADILGPDGPFVGVLEGFEPRAVQRTLADRVADAIAHQGRLIAESGTGTGKTLAYLVPALLSEKRILLSTGTKTLQEQLFKRDLPMVVGALGVTRKRSLLKGRANYLCRYRLAAATEQAPLLSARDTDLLAQVQGLAARSRSGDIGELTGIPEESRVWPLVTSTAENCLGAKCPDYQSCFVNRARNQALEADILIINHHLFCADLVLREDGFGRLLPGVGAVIFDEAHQLPDVASAFLGNSVSSGQLSDLCRDVLREEQQGQSQVRGLTDSVRNVDLAIDALRAVIGAGMGRHDWSQLDARAEFTTTMSQLARQAQALSDLLADAAAVSEGLSRCWQRALDLADRLSGFAEQGDQRMVRWAEVAPRAFRFHETPLEIGKSLREYLNDPGKGWIFTSATLSVDGRFDYFMSQVGVADAETLSLPSPFDYGRQALMYLPGGLTDPRDAAYTRGVVDAALPLLHALHGRTFMLFTSHRALQAAASMLRELGDFELLVQGSLPRTELLERFRTATDAVLLGTSSFWEGVDVRGAALSCVVIDKLPFEAPDEPVLRARLRAIEEGGGRPFVDYQLPNAVIALKQGVGRLIRDASDRGILMLCDPRLVTRGYGRVFLKSLPPLPATSSQDDVLAFAARL
jgi:ATP-dependent DNA helicase DinG